MRIPPKVGFLGVWSKQTRISGEGGEWERDSWGNRVTYGTLSASQIVLILFLLNTLWWKEIQKDR